jgi:hypothetical protein
VGKLVFAPALNQIPEIFRRGYVTIDLGPHLFGLWQAGGSVGQFFEFAGGTSIRVRRPNAWIGNIFLAPGDFNTIKVQFNPTVNGAFVLDFNVEQHKKVGAIYQVVGGEKFVFKTAP